MTAAVNIPLLMDDSVNITGYQILNSLRLRSASSAYMSRSFGNIANTWTFSAWVKRGKTGVGQTIAASRWASGVAQGIYFNANDTISINLNGVSVYTSTRVFRDISAWYHIVVRVTQSGTSYIYINGVQLGTWTSGATSHLFTSTANYINAIGVNGDQASNYFDGYLSEVHYVDGQALDPTNFGEFSGGTNQWIPKPYTGIYGTGGFYLPFSNSTSTSTIGYDATPTYKVAITTYGSPVISISEFYSALGSSMYFDGLPGKSWLVPARSQNNLGSGVFSVEVMIRPQSKTATTGNTSQAILSQGNNATNVSWILYVSATTGIITWGYTGQSVSVSGTYPVSYDTWSHILVTRDASNTERIFINGVLVSSRTNTTNYGTVSDFVTRIGAMYDTNYPGSYGVDSTSNTFKGNINNVKVVVGEIPTSYVTTSTTLGTNIFNPVISTTSVKTEALNNTVIFTPGTGTGGTSSSILNYANNWTSSGIDLTTTYAYSTSLLLNFSGTDGSTTFTDSGNYNLTATSVGSAQIDNAQSKFGGTSLYLEGTTSYVTIPTNTALTMGSSDFTYEAWINLDNKYASRVMGDASFYIGITGGVQLQAVAYNTAGSAFINIVDSAKLTSYYNSTWRHVAFTRSGSNFYLFLDGSLVGTSSSASALYATPGTLGIGSIGADVTNCWKGWIDGVRIIKGKALYITDFTPPSAELPETSDTYYNSTSLLLHGNGTNGSTTFIDSSSSNKTVSYTGTIQISTTKKIYGSGSIYKGTTGANYLSVSSDTSLNMGTGDFTWECWVYPTALANWSFILTKSSDTSFLALSMGFMANGSLIINMGSADGVTPGTDLGSIKVNQWQHYAVTRQGTTCRVFIDGIKKFTWTNSSDLTNSIPFRVGYHENATAFTGYIDDIRITKGVARYTEGFTLPTTAPVKLSYSYSAATYDITTDVPLQGNYSGNGQGNYPTLNPLAIQQTAGQYTFNAGNLSISGTNIYNSYVPTTQALPSTGKIYFEYTCSNSGGASLRDSVGIGKFTSISAYMGGTSDSVGYSGYTGLISGPASYGTYATWTNGDTIGCAINCNTGEIWFSKNDIWVVGNPSINLNPVATISNIDSYAPAVGGYAGGAGSYTINGSINLGQRPFRYSPPAGFVALNTYNMVMPTISKATQYFDISTYSGNNSTQTISNVQFKPDFIWIKARNSAVQYNVLQDIVRGKNSGNYLPLFSNSDTAEDTATNRPRVTAINADGFTMGNDIDVNGSSLTYAAWMWKAGGLPSDNTNGSITSSVSVNPTSGISIVTYTGTGAAATIGHGLGIIPKLIIVKNRSSAGVIHWFAYHSDMNASPQTGRLLLNTTGAFTADSTAWNNTSPTSSVFSIGTSTYTNTNTISHVAYAFTEIPGFSRFNKYTGNASADGPFVYLGFRPKYLMIKRADSTGSWYIIDTTRQPNNLNDTRLSANTSGAEVSGDTLGFDLLSNGFKVRNTNTDYNASNGTYIYAAFADAPFKYANAR